ncbi:hypothetical protein HRR83_003245 [Exophiala dermatitidis]|uniref:Uncharacterized protein n=2 Tax=Exophiala dermatitidis TaxID=5970 RepID=H6BNC2_EXODN|nr:uncharacterized protein HMPREF1120_00407 [Exophiala dermatitidis NIH/UT8656]KAJ4518303.1 hypothetical protein HRR74_004598 [Exophiala dermatitidis]EHY52192.1 hypothetical protein HMPREF1120_00407 [Exophiala dermatitidis NIH/UT8656]KAJ4521201.1 hypothetical protein HRR73_003542 [Exophiala dermatitidis]KAJ4547792.1 hypothetical protein HRR76_000416 [Exophiala dermatitidis]KAJ4553729.1 hypothetical protein HRR77_002105 [Exophiala dermatitidis]
MDLELLNCSICPKRPSFSDTSHLLTHVSSKGHLSHLHKLQVRSHQEIAAGVQLATYNQWYQQHGLGQLLSERMIMKEAKKAGRRKNAARKGAYVAQQSPSNHATSEQPMPLNRPTKGRKQGQRRQTRGRHARRAIDDDSDLDFSPVKKSRPRARQSRITSPVRRAQSLDGQHSSDDAVPVENRPQILVTPEHSKLKGTVWPGMDLFDAASDDMKRKRNQKKDGSVLRRMERLSALVEPREVVYSPGGHVKKARHIDDLEDDSSLIDGESPLPKIKPVRARKRQPLAEKDPNAPRLVRRKIKGLPAKKQADYPFMHGLPPLPYLPSSSTGDSYGLGTRFLATEEDEDGFKSNLSDMPSRQRPAQFTIFEDRSPGYTAASFVEDGRNHTQATNHLVLGRDSQTELPAVTAPWLQPEYQSTWQYTNPYTLYRHSHREHENIYDTMDVKEGDPPLTQSHPEFQGTCTNPLAWKSPDRGMMAPLLPSESPFSSFFGLFPGGMPPDDPFVTTKNPLAPALEHLGGEHDRQSMKVPQRPHADGMSAVAGNIEIHPRALSAPLT